MNTFPRLTIDDLINRLAADAKSLSNSIYSFAWTLHILLYPKNILHSKFCKRVFNSHRESSLFEHISVVVQFRSKKQMIGVHTSWIIATRTIVKNALTNWYGSFVEFPRKSMGISHLSIDKKFSISRPCSSFDPQPTRRSFINVIEEACGRIYSHLKVSPLDVIPPDVKASRGFLRLDYSMVGIY